MQTLDHSVFLMEGSSHSYQQALHCFGVFLTRRDEIRALLNYVSSEEEEVEKRNKRALLIFAILCNGPWQP